MQNASNVSQGIKGYADKAAETTHSLGEKVGDVIDAGAKIFEKGRKDVTNALSTVDRDTVTAAARTAALSVRRHPLWTLAIIAGLGILAYRMLNHSTQNS